MKNEKKIESLLRVHGKWEQQYEYPIIHSLSAVNHLAYQWSHFQNSLCISLIAPDNYRQLDETYTLNSWLK